MSRTKWSIPLALVIVLALAAGALSGCGGKAQESAAKPASITIALQGEPTTLDPQYADDGNMHPVTENVFETLLQLDGKTLQVKSCLATAYQRTGENTWRFTLRQGVTFHNGDPLTAEDVVFSVNRIIDPAYKSQVVGNVATIVKAVKVNDKTVDILTTGPDPLLPMRMTLLHIMNQKAVTAAGDKVVTTPVGTGPYKLNQWNRGVSLTLDAFPDYWGAKPSITAATYRFIQEDATRLAAVKAGEVDLSVNMLPEYTKELPQVKSGDGLEFYFIRLSQFKGIMKDPRIRLAACYAIDKDSLVKNLFQGYAAAAQGQLLKPGYVGFNKELKPYPYDPEKAKALLKEAEYNGEKIQLVSERGRWLKDTEISEAVADMLRSVGFNVQLTFLSFQEWLATLFDATRAPDMQFSSHSNPMFDADRTFTSCLASTGTQSTYHDPVLDDLITQARTELDPAKRQATYEKIGKTAYDDPAWISLVNVKDIYGLSTRVNWEPRQDGRIILSEIILK
ncbi:MAG: ABC transporter substrate-binding protein [Bacillota bacterium]